MIALNTKQKKRKFSADTHEAQIQYLHIPCKIRTFSAATHKEQRGELQTPRKKTKNHITHT